MKILITGGTGFIGTSLVKALREKGHELRVLSRKEKLKEGEYYWNYQKYEIDENALKDIDGIIHLAGATISKKWTKAYKEELYSSRVDSLQFLGDKLQAQNQGLKFILSASGIGYYGWENKNIPYKETEKPGEDFVSKLCIEWEKVVEEFPVKVEQKYILRTSLVLDRKGGILKKMLPSFLLNFGAIIGNGKQIMPCISLTDMVDMYIFGLENKLDGIYNAVSFNLEQKKFASTLARMLQKPLMLRIPSALIRFIFGEMSVILLNGQAISNSKIIETGFIFQQKDLKSIPISD